MGTPRYPRDMASEWQKMKREIKGTFSSANIRKGAAKIASSIVDIYNGLVLHAGSYFLSLYSNGNTSVLIGRNSLEGQIVEGIQIRRPNGSLVLWSYGVVGSGDSFWALYDKVGNIVVSDDAVSGQGLATPWIPYTWARTALLATPADTNTTGTYAPVHTVIGYLQHPMFRLDGYMRVTGTAKAGLRVVDPLTNEVVLEATDIGEGFVAIPDAPHINYVYSAWFRYDVQIRVSSGTGSVGFTPIAMHGVQSP